MPAEESDSDNEDPFDCEVFATERKKRETRAFKLPELQAAAPIMSSSTFTVIPALTPAASATRTATTSVVPTRTTPQYRYQSSAEDQRRCCPTRLLRKRASRPTRCRMREIDIRIGDRVTETGVIDPGLQMIVIREDLARKAGAIINTSRVLQMKARTE